LNTGLAEIGTSIHEYSDRATKLSLSAGERVGVRAIKN